MEDGDDWLAIDKLEHILFCFFISIVSSLIAMRTRYSFIRRRSSIWVGSIVSLSAGAAKEFADQLGFFNSAGASTKDFVADLIGILIAALLLHSYKSFAPTRTRPESSNQTQIQLSDMV